MRLLGIDFGQAKVGVALAETKISEPLEVIRYSSEEKLIEKLTKIIKSHNIERIVVGKSERDSKKDALEFGKKLKEKLNIEVVFHDETLSSLDAQFLAREAGIKRKKRKDMEDAYAAAIILQSYLDQVQYK